MLEESPRYLRAKTVKKYSKSLAFHLFETHRRFPKNNNHTTAVALAGTMVRSPGVVQSPQCVVNVFV